MRLGKDAVRDLADRLGKCAPNGYVFSAAQVNEKLMAQDFEIYDYSLMGISICMPLEKILIF